MTWTQILDFVSETRDVWLAVVAILSALSGWVYNRRKAQEDQKRKSYQDIYDLIIEATQPNINRLARVNTILYVKPKIEICIRYLPQNILQTLNEGFDCGRGSDDQESIDKLRQAYKKLEEVKEFLKSELSKS